MHNNDQLIEPASQANNPMESKLILLLTQFELLIHASSAPLLQLDTIRNDYKISKIVYNALRKQSIRLKDEVAKATVILQQNIKTLLSYLSIHKTIPTSEANIIAKAEQAVVSMYQTIQQAHNALCEMKTLGDADEYVLVSESLYAGIDTIKILTRSLTMLPSAIIASNSTLVATPRAKYVKM
jgi:hypothetical protein